MPILVVSMRTSLNTESSCAATKSGSIRYTDCTPRVFCATSAVMTEQP
jgi:hypothetical protein